ncbi:MAG: hypothetical protein IIT60_04770, partial [Muribaculaceae bacterium]|nr:hypothetical protein [Muribaculaceae bacterium]
KGVTLLCPDNIGVVQNDSVLFANGEGSGLLSAVFQGDTISIPINVIVPTDGIRLRNDSIITDTYRTYTVELLGTVLDKEMPIDPAALNWMSANEGVVRIDAATGVLQGVADGHTCVVGSVDNLSDTLHVTVEKPTAHAMPIDPNLDISTWTITQSGGKDGVAQAMGNGFVYTYTGASSRAPKLTLTKYFRLWSLPDTLRVRLNPGEAPVKNVVFGLRAHGGGISYQTITPGSIVPNREMIVDLPIASWIDADDMANYPLQLNSI